MVLFAYNNDLLSCMASALG